MDYEHNVHALSEEIDRLNSVLEKKNNEIGNYSKKLQEVEYIMNSSAQES